MGKGIMEQIEDGSNLKYTPLTDYELNNIFGIRTKPKLPTESYKFDILDLSPKEIIKHPRKKLLWRKEQ